MIVQKIIITLSLIIIYFVGFGITLIFILVFRRKMLTGEFGKNTIWIEAEGYESDINGAIRQS